VDQDEHEIRTLIEEWAAAVHRGDMDTVLAGHSGDIVMFVAHGHHSFPLDS
jgi:ketosteroid isomerase-like protein